MNRYAYIYILDKYTHTTYLDNLIYIYTHMHTIYFASRHAHAHTHIYIYISIYIYIRTFPMNDTLSPTIMEVENGGLEDDFSLQGAHFPLP